MNRVLAISFFIIIFILVYGLLNFYVLNKLSSLLNIKKDFYFYVLFAVLTISIILTTAIATKSQNKAAKSAYTLSAVWLGLVFLLFCGLLLYELLSRIVALPALSSALVIIIFCLILSIYSMLNAHDISVKAIKIPINGLEKQTKIIHLSDIHLGIVNKQDYLKEIVNKVNLLNPQAVMITGDLFDGSASIDEEILKPLKELKMPVFFVIGNHEQIEGLDKIIPLVQKTNMITLRDEYKEWENLTILGVEFAETPSHLRTALDTIPYPKDKPIILLYHAPALKANELAKHNISLHLAGHTHNGQIFPFNFIVGLFYAYTKGLHADTKSSSFVYVNSGTGTWGPPMRLGSKSEITLIELVPKNQRAPKKL